MLNPGDVVVGPFAGKDRVFHHQSVVVGQLVLRGQTYALLVYTTSKSNGSTYGGKFLPEDLHLSGWSNDCEFDASRVSFTPISRLKKRGEISAATLKKIEDKFTLALNRGILDRHFVKD